MGPPVRHSSSSHPTPAGLHNSCTCRASSQLRKRPYKLDVTVDVGYAVMACTLVISDIKSCVRMTSPYVFSRPHLHSPAPSRSLHNTFRPQRIETILHYCTHHVPDVFHRCDQRRSPRSTSCWMVLLARLTITIDFIYRDCHHRCTNTMTPTRLPRATRIPKRAGHTN